MESTKLMWNGQGPAGVALDPCVHDLYAEQVHRTPDATAVVGSRELTYAQLDACAGRLAAHLVDLGAGPGKIIGIVADPSLELTIGVLAVLKAGAAYLPIDPGVPAERIAFILADAGPEVSLIGAGLAERLPAQPGETVRLEEWRECPAPGVSGSPASAVTADDLAYVIYDPGSAGRPAGVAMPHRPLANLLHWERTTRPAEPGARTLLLGPLAGGACFQEMFATWCAGGTLVLPGASTRRDRHSLPEMLRDLEIERVALSAAALQDLAETDIDIPTLRRVIVSDVQLAGPPRRFFARHPHCRLAIQYAPAETQVVTSLELEGPVDMWPDVLPIGRPISEAKVYLLDDRFEPVQDGLAGELYVGGTTLARGYLGGEERSSERFIADPFDDRPGARMYRSAERACRLPDGTFALVRQAEETDDGGASGVDVTEVERVLSEHEAIGQAAVVLVEDRLGASRIVAYVMSGNGRRPVEREVLSHARRRLPSYLVPRHIVVMDALPLTPAGQLDRHALPVPEGPGLNAAVAPSTDLERSMTEIWQRLLGVSEVGVDDDFFDLGGHSLLGVELVYEIEHQLDRTCTLTMLFRNPTIRSLAAEMHAGGAGATESVVLELVSGSGPIVFCICGVHVYQELAEELTPDFSMHGIFLPVEQELFAAGRGRLSVEDMARRYLAAVREQQPNGPYLLLGFCFGGILAYEVAQQLRAAGEEVSMLVMLDSTLNSLMPRYKERLAPRVKQLALRQCDRLPQGWQRRLLGDEWVSDTNRLERTRGRIYSEAMRRYRVSAYPGPAVLVKPEASMEVRVEEAEAAWGWRAHIAELEVCEVPGTHVTHLQRGNAHVLAEVLRPRLRRVLAGRRPA